MKKLIAAVALTFLASSSAFAMLDFETRQFTYDKGTDSFTVTDSNGVVSPVIVVQELAAVRLDALKNNSNRNDSNCLSKGTYSVIAGTRVFTLLALGNCGQ